MPLPISAANRAPAILVAMIIVTSNGIPGYRIDAVLGEVMGMTVRSANFGQNLTAGFRSLGGGEMPEYTKLVYDSRNEVMNRMWQECVKRGGNAIIAMRFDTGSISQNFTEVCAYGTAVVAVPLAEGEPGSTGQSRARAAAGEPTPGQWPQLPGDREVDDDGVREGVRPGAAGGPPSTDHTPDQPRTRPTAQPGPSPEPPPRDGDFGARDSRGRDEAASRQDDAGDRNVPDRDVERPRSPQDQKPNSGDSWLDLG